MESGKMESSMEEACIINLEKKSMESGTMERDLDG